LKQSYERTKSVIAQHRTEWERLAQALIEHEALDAKQVMQAINGEVVTRKMVNKFRPSESETPPPPSSDVGVTVSGVKPTPIVKAREDEQQ
jgi:hypothetical protein